mmetsp:Transcript_8019/g.26669  ORF Transcript_8019/g.26669 Transcript_8019/m.26669 type:complete len:188 (+) Transcript_8019:32-595(+)
MTDERNARRTLAEGKARLLSSRPHLSKLAAPVKDDAPVTDMVPIFIALDTPQQQYRETFLWRHPREAGATSTTPKDAAQQMRLELGLNPNYDRLLHDQISSGLSHYTQGWSEDGERLIRIKVDVTFGDETFRDEIDWNLNEEQNGMVENYVYNALADAGLSLDFVPLVLAQVKEQIAAAKEPPALDK